MPGRKLAHEIPSEVQSPTPPLQSLRGILLRKCRRRPETRRSRLRCRCRNPPTCRRRRLPTSRPSRRDPSRQNSSRRQHPLPLRPCRLSPQLPHPLRLRRRRRDARLRRRSRPGRPPDRRPRRRSRIDRAPIRAAAFDLSREQKNPVRIANRVFHFEWQRESCADDYFSSFSAAGAGATSSGCASGSKNSPAAAIASAAAS